MTNMLHTDVLVIGSGIAGGVAALQLADLGVNVTLVTRAVEPKDSNTLWAQGGIIYKGANDTAHDLIMDLQQAGAGIGNPRAMQILAEEGPRLIEDILINKIGVPFDRSDDGDLSIVLEGAHSHPRIIHAADATGRAIEIALLNTLKTRANVQLLTGHTAIDLLTLAHHSTDRRAVYQPDRCVGAYVFDREQRHVRRILAQKTILATGGLGQLFLRTSNPGGARGDGLAMAYRAGARVINTEYVQFHPTTFSKKFAPNFLISEAVRGEGARLVNAHGELFMERYAPEWKDLAPRDVVSRSIHQEMQETGADHVYLDLRSYMSPEEIGHHFPNIMAMCAKHGVDITKELVPVTPAAHYSCGGVWVDDVGRTNVADLYAVGEVSCTGLHGANRLASSSLLEGLVWGYRAANHAAGEVSDRWNPNDLCIPPWDDSGTSEPDALLIEQDVDSIRHIMWNYIGLVRTAPRLQRALRELRHLEVEVEQFYRVAKLTDEMIGLRNMVRVALVITKAALRNKQSLGAHYRI